MFYSEALLSKTGPLARVWLAANLERKMGKKDYVTVNLENSIEAIVDQGSAPMALRLSGQLLLGVVRIYSKKAKYLLDDCNEALLKIKMAFRPGTNVDLPADQSHVVNSAMLMLPDALTELDLLAPMPDPAQLLGELELGRSAQDATLLDWGTQSLITDSIERSDRAERHLMLEEEPLDLDLGDTTLPSVELGRRERPSEVLHDVPDDSLKLYEDELPLDLGDEPLPPEPEAGPGLGDIDMDDIGIQIPEENVPITAPSPSRRRDRATLSPLSDIRASVERDLETTFRQSTEIPEESVHEAAQQRAKRRKLLAEDRETELRSADIRAQQNDRSKILKPMSFLPRDPMLLALMTMQKNGAFVTDILGDGRLARWAPELRDVLSVEVIRRSGELKRKRDSGVADMYLDEDATAAEKVAPQLEIPQDEDEGLPGAVEEDITRIPSVGFRLPTAEEEEELPMDEGPMDAFDDTTMPILHPADAGPISVGTRHAVHLLRDRFAEMGISEASTPSKRSNTSVLFQELLPEERTTRTDATKMFFEVLVLATKDAIKVEQPQDVLGEAIRLRAKRGLWGSWAEEKAGGEIATQQED